VTGTVLNAATDEPVPRALVTLHAAAARTTFSDNNGAFSIEGVPEGRFTITAEKPGFFNQQERESGGRRRPQLIQTGPDMEAVALRLAPEAVIYGRLLDANEQPIESVSVRLFRSVARNGVLRWESRGYTSSDEDGAFRLPNLQPGRYYLSAGPEVSRDNSAFTQPEKPRTGWPGLYYPGVPDLASAAPIRLGAGQQVEADLTMNRVPLYAVAGMVSGVVPGQPVSLQVLSPSGDALPVATQFSSETGTFDIRLPAGMYRLRAMGQAGEQQLRADTRISVNKDITQLHLALQPAAIIPIHARMENRAQDSGQRSPAVLARSIGTEFGDIPPLSVQLISSEPGGTDAYSIVQETKGNRSLVLQGIEPGRYSTLISPHGGWYVESATCGSTNLLNEDLVIAGGGGCSMELLLRNDSGMISLSVKTSQPNIGGMALLVPVRGRAAPRTIPFNSSAKSGELWANMNVAPGEYMVYAFDSIDGIEYSNPEALRPYTSQATPVTISPGETTKVTAQLIQSGADTP
jgi:hypothetical protein